MMVFNSPDRYLIGTILLLVISSMPGLAKTGRNAQSVASVSHLTSANSQAIRSFESILQPYFDQKNGSRAGSGQTIATPSDMDIHSIVRNWRLLSASFKESYLASLGLPESFNVFIDPTGNFEIYYTTIGSDAVDRTDTYRYGPDSLHWRTKTSGANGVPDYVDAVSWALDSAWSMEINRFGFGKPLAFSDNTHSSKRYKIVLKDTQGYYAFTWPVPSNQTIPSYIEMSCEYSSFPGYQTHPLDAVNVTAAHEFFHAIQFASGSVWSDSRIAIDEMPEAWLEGTSVMMEDLCFDDVNDYLQYLADYFDNPTQTLLLNSSLDAYTAGVLALYLYRFAGSSPSIDFIRTVFMNNTLSKPHFSDNITATATALGTRWPVLLNRFHTGSWFTGQRADSNLFYKDAALMPMLRIVEDLPDAQLTIRKRIRPYSMQTFSLTPDAAQGDTCYVEFLPSSNSANPLRSASVITVDTIGKRSISSISFSSDGSAELMIAPWRQYTSVLAIVTNGHPSLDDSMAIAFVPGSSNQYLAGETLMATAAMAAPVVASATISGLASRTIVGEFSIASAALSAAQLRALTSADLLPSSIVYRVEIPPYWKNAITMNLAVVVPASGLDSLQKNFDVAAPYVSLYRFSELRQQWEKVTAVFSLSHDSASWQSSALVSGTYTLLQPGGNHLDIFPNPVKLSKGQAVTIRGTNILDISIYSLGGSLIFQVSSTDITLDKNRDGFPWPVTNQSGAKVFPGTYFVQIGYKDMVTRGLKKTRAKLLVLP
jgi:hypothetical protein